MAEGDTSLLVPTSYLQRGQDAFIFNHLSIHSTWKTWRHGNSRSSSSSTYFDKQIQQTCNEFKKAIEINWILHSNKSNLCIQKMKHSPCCEGTLIIKVASYSNPFKHLHLDSTSIFFFLFLYIFVSSLLASFFLLLLYLRSFPPLPNRILHSLPYHNTKACKESYY